MTIQRSDDNGNTWSRKWTIEPNRAGAYSGLTSVNEKGCIGLVWETSYAKCNGDSCAILYSLVKSDLQYSFVF